MKKEQINVRVTKKVKEKLEEKADEQGMSLSEYVRYLIAKDLETK